MRVTAFVILFCGLQYVTADFIHDFNQNEMKNAVVDYEKSEDFITRGSDGKEYHEMVNKTTYYMNERNPEHPGEKKITNIEIVEDENGNQVVYEKEIMLDQLESTSAASSLASSSSSSSVSPSAGGYRGKGNGSTSAAAAAGANGANRQRDYEIYRPPGFGGSSESAAAAGSAASSSSDETGPYVDFWNGRYNDGVTPSFSKTGVPLSLSGLNKPSGSSSAATAATATAADANGTNRRSNYGIFGQAPLGVDAGSGASSSSSSSSSASRSNEPSGLYRRSRLGNKIYTPETNGIIGQRPLGFGGSSASAAAGSAASSSADETGPYIDFWNGRYNDGTTPSFSLTDFPLPNEPSGSSAAAAAVAAAATDANGTNRGSDYGIFGQAPLGVDAGSGASSSSSSSSSASRSNEPSGLYRRSRLGNKIYTPETNGIIGQRPLGFGGSSASAAAGSAASSSADETGPYIDFWNGRYNDGTTPSFSLTDFPLPNEPSGSSAAAAAVAAAATDANGTNRGSDYGIFGQAPLGVDAGSGASSSSSSTSSASRSNEPSGLYRRSRLGNKIYTPETNGIIGQRPLGFGGSSASAAAGSAASSSADETGPYIDFWNGRYNDGTTPSFSKTGVPLSLSGLNKPSGSSSAATAATAAAADANGTNRRSDYGIFGQAPLGVDAGSGASSSSSSSSSASRSNEPSGLYRRSRLGNVIYTPETNGITGQRPLGFGGSSASAAAGSAASSSADETGPYIDFWNGRYNDGITPSFSLTDFPLPNEPSGSSAAAAAVAAAATDANGTNRRSDCEIFGQAPLGVDAGSSASSSSSSSSSASRSNEPSGLYRRSGLGNVIYTPETNGIIGQRPLGFGGSSASAAAGSAASSSADETGPYIDFWNGRYNDGVTPSFSKTGVPLSLSGLNKPSGSSSAATAATAAAADANGTNRRSDYGIFGQAPLGVDTGSGASSSSSSSSSASRSNEPSGLYRRIGLGNVIYTPETYGIFGQRPLGFGGSSASAAAGSATSSSADETGPYIDFWNGRYNDGTTPSFSLTDFPLPNEPSGSSAAAAAVAAAATDANGTNRGSDYGIFGQAPLGVDAGSGASSSSSSSSSASRSNEPSGLYRRSGLGNVIYTPETYGIIGQRPLGFGGSSASASAGSAAPSSADETGPYIDFWNGRYNDGVTPSFSKTGVPLSLLGLNKPSGSSAAAAAVAAAATDANGTNRGSDYGIFGQAPLGVDAGSGASSSSSSSSSASRSNEPSGLYRRSRLGNKIYTPETNGIIGQRPLGFGGSSASAAAGSAASSSADETGPYIDFWNGRYNDGTTPSFSLTDFPLPNEPSGSSAAAAAVAAAATDANGTNRGSDYGIFGQAPLGVDAGSGASSSSSSTSSASRSNEPSGLYRRIGLGNVIYTPETNGIIGQRPLGFGGSSASAAAGNAASSSADETGPYIDFWNGRYNDGTTPSFSLTDFPLPNEPSGSSAAAAAVAAAATDANGTNRGSDYGIFGQAPLGVDAGSGASSSSSSSSSASRSNEPSGLYRRSRLGNKIYTPETNGIIGQRPLGFGGSSASAAAGSAASSSADETGPYIDFWNGRYNDGTTPSFSLTDFPLPNEPSGSSAAAAAVAAAATDANGTNRGSDYGIFGQAPLGVDAGSGASSSSSSSSSASRSNEPSGLYRRSGLGKVIYTPETYGINEQGSPGFGGSSAAAAAAAGSAASSSADETGPYIDFWNGRYNDGTTPSFSLTDFPLPNEPSGSSAAAAAVAAAATDANGTNRGSDYGIFGQAPLGVDAGSGASSSSSSSSSASRSNEPSGLYRRSRLGNKIYTPESNGIIGQRPLGFGGSSASAAAGSAASSSADETGPYIDFWNGRYNDGTTPSFCLTDFPLPNEPSGSSAAAAAVAAAATDANGTNRGSDYGIFGLSLSGPNEPSGSSSAAAAAAAASGTASKSTDRTGPSGPYGLSKFGNDYYFSPSDDGLLNRQRVYGTHRRGRRPKVCPLRENLVVRFKDVCVGC